MQVHLQSPGSWQASENCWSRGCACLDGRLLRGTELHDLARSLDSEADAAAFARSAGGFYSLIRIPPEGDAFAVVDRGRGVPLFYCTHQGDVVVSDSARALAEMLPPQPPDPLPRIEFMEICCVSGNETLHPEIRQLRAGEMLVSSAQKDAPHIVRYFRYRQHADRSRSRAEMYELCERALAAAVSNLVAYANGRPIAIPLSGGLDSTLLLTGLARSGYDNFRAFTYGRAGGSEMHHSQRVAEELGVKWTHVPYSNELWARWFGSPERREYYETADNLCVLPHIQDFPAVGELKRNGWLADGTVIAPGMSIESFYGSPSQPPHQMQYDTQGVDPDRLAEVIIDAKYLLWPQLYSDPQIRSGLKARVLDSIGDIEFHGNAASCNESWFTHEKMSKFYNNSVRVYEYWGCDWWLPLWDKPYIEFWQTVPPKWRSVRKFTEELVAHLYHRTTGSRYEVLAYERPLMKGARLVRYASRYLPFIRHLYNWLKRDLRYDADPMEWYGLFDRKQYLQLCHPRLNINSLLVKEYFGELEALPR